MPGLHRTRRFLITSLAVIAPLILGGCCCDVFETCVSGPRLRVASIAWDPGYCAPCSSLEVEIRLKNKGAGRARGVWARMTLIDDCAVVGERSLSFPDIRGGDCGRDEVEFRCVEDLDDFDRWELEIHWVDDSGDSYRCDEEGWE